MLGTLGKRSFEIVAHSLDSTQLELSSVRCETSHTLENSCAEPTRGERHRRRRDGWLAEGVPRFNGAVIARSDCDYHLTPLCCALLQRVLAHTVQAGFVVDHPSRDASARG